MNYSILRTASILILTIICGVGAEHYRFDIASIPQLRSFELTSDHLDVTDKVASRSMIVENSDDSITISFYRGQSTNEGELIYKNRIKEFGASKETLKAGDEGVKVGRSAAVFRCGEYVCKLVGRSKNSRIAAGAFEKGRKLTTKDFTASDFKVWPDLDLGKLASTIASAIVEQTQEAEPLTVIEVNPKTSTLIPESSESFSTVVDVAVNNPFPGNVAVIGQSDGLYVNYTDNKLSVRHNAAHTGWNTLRVTVVNEALQVATGSCRILSDNVKNGPIDPEKALNELEANRVRSPSDSTKRQQDWAAEAYAKGLKGEEARVFFEAKLQENQAKGN